MVQEAKHARVGVGGVVGCPTKPGAAKTTVVRENKFVVTIPGALVTRRANALVQIVVAVESSFVATIPGALVMHVESVLVQTSVGRAKNTATTIVGEAVMPKRMDKSVRIRVALVFATVATTSGRLAT